jgi:hypothetical protein
MSEKGRAPDDWSPDNSLCGKASDAPCPPCTLCGQPMFYMFGMVGVFKMHSGTGQFLCRDEPPITEAVK